MAINGNGLPKCNILTTEITFERPLKGSIRDNPYDDLTQEFTNIFGSIRRGLTQIRFDQTYIFTSISNSDFNVLVRAKNMNTIVRWMPHSDIDAIVHPCHILECKEITIDGYEYTKHFYVHVRSIDTIHKYPSPDNQVLCRAANVIGFYTYKSDDTSVADIYTDDVVFVVIGHGSGGTPLHYYKAKANKTLIVPLTDENFSNTTQWEDLGQL
jgi:hypothetical protein